MSVEEWKNNFSSSRVLLEMRIQCKWLKIIAQIYGQRPEVVGTLFTPRPEGTRGGDGFRELDL